MPTRLSSQLTPLYRFVLPWLVSLGFGFGVLTAYLHPESVHGPSGWSRDYAWALMLVVGVLTSLLVWWVGGRVMRVELADDELIISNYRFEIRVALADLEKISGPTWINPPRYTLTFSTPTEFGPQVTFIPPQDLTLRRAAEARAIGALREAWERARNAPRAP